MAKKKTKKEEKKKFEYTNEVVGIIMILSSIVGIGEYGPAGNFIKAFRRVTYSILVKKRHVRNQTRPTLSYSVSILDTEDSPRT